MKTTTLLCVTLSLFVVGCDDASGSRAPEGAVEVPDDHLAAQLIADNASADEVSDAAVMCAASGTGAGPQRICAIEDDGLLVLFPLTMPSDFHAVITGSAFTEEVDVPLPALSGDSLPRADELFAIPHDHGSMRVELWYDGEPSGASFAGPVAP